MKRWAFNLTAGLLAFLCVAAVALWGRSYWGSDYVSRQKLVRADAMVVTSRVQQLSWTRGEIRWSGGTQTYHPRGQAGLTPPELDRWRWGWGRLGEKHWGWQSYPAAGFWGRLGFKRYSSGLYTSWSDSTEEITTVPAWLAVLVLGAWPVVWMTACVRGRRRYLAGRCAGCGYDLRASPERCPECGAAAAKPGGSTLAP